MAIFQVDRQMLSLIVTAYYSQLSRFAKILPFFGTTKHFDVYYCQLFVHQVVILCLFAWITPLYLLTSCFENPNLDWFYRLMVR